MNGSKVYKGEIHNWKWIHVEGDSYIRGVPNGHPKFVDWIITSKVVSYTPATGELETLNSRYKLIGEEHG